MKQYTAAKYIEGIRACILNIVALTDDADLLIANGRHARAYALLLIAMEEVAKVNMLKSWAVDRWTGKAMTKEEQDFRRGIFKDHIGKLKRAAMGLYANEEFKMKWGMKPGPPDPEFVRLMRGMKQFLEAKNGSLYLHTGSGGFEAPLDSSYIRECKKLRQWIHDLLRWVKGGTLYFVEHDVQWYIQDGGGNKEFHASIESLRNCLKGI